MNSRSAWCSYRDSVNWPEGGSGSFFKLNLQIIIRLVSGQHVSTSFTKNIPEFVIFNGDAAHVDRSSLGFC